VATKDREDARRAPETAVDEWQRMHGLLRVAMKRVMDEATALERHPEAVKVPGTMVLREVFETDVERLSHMNTKPPIASRS
jgi:hypothetical protein